MSQIQEIRFEDFNFLLKASSKQQVVELCKGAFENRANSSPPNHLVKHAAEWLGIDVADAVKLTSSLCNLIKTVLFHGYSSLEAIATVFPTNFHKNLCELLSKIIADNYSNWKANVVSSSVSLPKLAEFDWRVDLKMASGKVARMSAPTCILHLKIQNPSLPTSHEDRLSTLNVELSKEKLDTMLNGLGRIRDQLSAVAKK